MLCKPHYVQTASVDATLRALAVLPKESDAYKMQLDHLQVPHTADARPLTNHAGVHTLLLPQEVTKLKHEIDRITHEQKLDRVRREAERERTEGKAELEHEAWVNEQRRRVK